MALRTVAKLLGMFTALILTVAVTTVGFLWFAAGEIYDYSDTYQPGETDRIDVVLCLAGGKNRIPRAVELWQHLKARQLGHPPVLFFSGTGTHANMGTLIEQGVPAPIVNHIRKEEVVFENVSENTFENAQLFASFARQNRWKRVVLVTADYHMRRAEFILRKALDPDVEIFLSTVDAEHFGRNTWHHNSYAIRVTLLEYIKWLYYRYSY